MLEIIIVVSISSLLLAALLRFLVAGFPIATITYAQQRSTEVARLQLNRIASVLREARRSDTGAYPLVEMSPQRIIVYADIDNDSVTERVRYELEGTNLVRGIVKPTRVPGFPLVYELDDETWGIVARSIRNGSDPIFTYFSGDYPTNPTPLFPVDLTGVKFVQFRLVIDVDQAVNPPPIEIVSQVQLRNLKTNLADIVMPSLRVTITDIVGAPISQATVHLTDNGFDKTLITDAAGAAPFSNLPVSDDYTLEVSADGYQAVTQVVTVENATQITVILISE